MTTSLKSGITFAQLPSNPVTSLRSPKSPSPGKPQKHEKHVRSCLQHSGVTSVPMAFGSAVERLSLMFASQIRMRHPTATGPPKRSSSPPSEKRRKSTIRPVWRHTRLLPLLSTQWTAWKVKKLKRLGSGWLPAFRKNGSRTTPPCVISSAPASPSLLPAQPAGACVARAIPVISLSTLSTGLLGPACASTRLRRLSIL